jgi:hypothetical protein
MGTNMILCPLTNTKIAEYDCYLICEAAEGNIPENEMPCINNFEQERKVCIECKYHNID